MKQTWLFKKRVPVAASNLEMPVFYVFNGVFSQPLLLVFERDVFILYEGHKITAVSTSMKSKKLLCTFTYVGTSYRVVFRLY